MRRRVATLLLSVLLAPAGLRIMAQFEDTEAMRCAIACGHTVAALPGAACCPMADAPNAGPAFKTCSPGKGSALAPPAPGQPLLLAALVRLLPPDTARPNDLAATREPLSAAPRPVDHVPLVLG